MNIAYMSSHRVTPAKGLVANWTPSHFVSEYFFLTFLCFKLSYTIQPFYVIWSSYAVQIIVTTINTTTTTTTTPPPHLHHLQHHLHHHCILPVSLLYPPCTPTVSCLYPPCTPTVSCLYPDCIPTVS